MKKLLLLPAALIAFACSSDDDSNSIPTTYIDNNPNFKAVYLAASCGDMVNSVYCITAEEEAEVSSFIASEAASGNSCPMVTLQDVDGVERTGYVTSISTNLGCTRQTNP